MKKISLTLLCLGLTSAQAVSLDDKAPGFALTNFAHKKYELANYKGNVVFINFWASWCAPCQIELPQLDRLAASYKGKKVQIIAITVDREAADAKRLLTRLKLLHPSLKILWDPEGHVASAYDIDGMPSSFIVDTHGLIRFKHMGFHSDNPAQWHKEINQLLANGMDGRTAVRPYNSH